MNSRRLASSAAAAVALALVVAGCGSDTTEKTKPGASDLVVTGPVGAAQKSADPQAGGTLKTGSLYAPGGLDPVMVTVDGTVGGAELSAIFDVLVSYDPTTREYAGRLAESIESNDDATQWTLTLRDGVKFSDGTDLDADAVVSSIKRFTEDAASVHYYPHHEENLAKLSAPDAGTVTFDLREPDTNFPWVLTQGWGMVTSPTALKKQGQADFSQAPVGAGPFVVSKYVANERLELTRSPSYDLEAVHLEGLEFSWVPDPSALSQALTSGDLDAVMLRDPKLIKKALAAPENSGFAWKRYMSSVLITNVREGRPTAELDLRRAIAQGVSTKNINDRLYSGAGDVTTALFPSGPLANDVEPLAYDPAAAKKLVADVKERTGWDGKLVLAGLAVSEANALAVQSNLGAIGIEVVLDLSSSYSALHKRLTVSHDFDLTLNSYAVDESAPMIGVQSSLLRKDDYNTAGYYDDDMAEAVSALGAATSPEDLSAAAGEVQRLWNEQVPSISLSSLADVWVWKTSDVFGITPNAMSIPLFAGAWKLG